MTADREAMYWHSNKEWYDIDKENDCYVLTDKAPKRAVASFELYKEINWFNYKQTVILVTLEEAEKIADKIMEPILSQFDYAMVDETDELWIFTYRSDTTQEPMSSLPITVNKKTGEVGYVILPSKEGFKIMKKRRSVGIIPDN